MPTPPKAPHIAHRIHLYELPEQSGKKLFGLSLCAAPFFHGATNPPLLTGVNALDPYLPWTWVWRADNATTPAGFRWTLFARLQHGAAAWAWKIIPDRLLRVYGPPAGFSDDLMEVTQSGAPSNGANVHDTWWRKELLRLTVDNNGAWKTVNPPAKPFAHAQQLEQFYAAPPSASIVVDEGMHDSHPDLLGARMLRWATAHPPYNYHNRLAAVAECPTFQELKTALETEYPGFTLPPTGVKIAGLPLWIADAAAVPTATVFEPNAETLIVEQNNVPINGLSGPGTFLRRSYGKIVDVKKGEPVAPSGRDLGVDVEPWRKDLEDRLARCVDLPSLLLDAPREDAFAAVVGQQTFVEWVIDLSADLFQAAPWTLKQKPANATEWAHQLVNAAGLAKLDETEVAKLSGVLSLLPDSFSEKFKEGQFDGELSALKESLEAPLRVLTGLETLAANSSKPILRDKAKRVLAKLPKLAAPERTKLDNLTKANASPRLLATPADDLKLYREMKLQIDAEDVATPLEPLVNVETIRTSLHALGGAADLLQRLIVLLPDTPEHWTAMRQTLQNFLQIQRDPKLFARLRAEVAQTTVNLTQDPETDFLLQALRETLRFPVSPGGTLRKAIVPSLREPSNPGDPLPVQSIIDGLTNRVTQRYQTQDKVPQLPAPANVVAVLQGFKDYLVTNKTQSFRDTIYGDRSLPLGKPHGFSIIGQDQEDVFESLSEIEAHVNANLAETAGALLFGRVAKPADLDSTPWLPLNAGVLRLQETENGAKTYVAQENGAGGLRQQVIQNPLRPAIVQQRLSRRAEYDNRPLVAISRKSELIKNKTNRLQPSAASRESALLDFLFPARDAFLPALRYYGKDVHYQFCWVDESNACTVPPGCWTTHPALLGILPPDVADLKSRGIHVSRSRPYFRRVGIGTVGLTFAGAISSKSTPLQTEKNSWPLLPPDIFPIAAEARSKAEEGAPKSPLVLLYPKDDDPATPRPSLSQPQELAHEMTIKVHKPRTSDDNWERWVAANPTTSFEARKKVCAEAHRVRDRVADLEGEIEMWQPDDPALDQQCLIVFRRLYPDAAAGTSEIGFIRKWKASTNAGTYGAARDFFSDPISVTLRRDPTLPSSAFVAATGEDSFRIAVGVVVEMSVYALLPETRRDLFDDKLFTPPAGPNPLGVSLGKLLANVTMKDTAPDDTWLAVSPNALRLETPNLNLPSAAQTYNSLIVSGQGGKVSLGLASGRDPALFDLVHEVVAQEQIWRWNGKPCMPEDFLVNGESSISLPDIRPITADHIPWDGIGFHHREDREHLATICKLPLLDRGAPAKDKTGDIVFTDDKNSDARALYFRFSAQLRSRYFGAWPATVQAGSTMTIDRGVDPLWKRYVLPHRILAPLKKPSVVMVIPMLASGKPEPEVGGTAGVIAIVREACFEQAGIAEKMECELVESDVFQRDDKTLFVKPSGTKYFQAGYDPTLGNTAMGPSDDAGTTKSSPLQMSGPVGLTFDQGSRDPLVVNSMFFVEVDRAKLKKFVSPDTSTPSPAASHLFCQIRFRRTIRPGYEADGSAVGADHPLASDWTEAQWVKFLPDSDLLRPSDASRAWLVTRSNTVSRLTNWERPKNDPSIAKDREARFVYFLCVTRHDVDAVGRPATEFHSLHRLKDDGVLEALWPTGAPLEKGPRLRGRVIEALTMKDHLPVTSDNWRNLFFPDPELIQAEPGSITEDVQIVPQALSAAYVLHIA